MSDLMVWIGKAVEGFRKHSDLQRFEMSYELYEGTLLMDKDPEQALAHFQRGHNMAIVLSEPWWEMLFDHWTCQTLIHRVRRIDSALDLAAKAVAVIESDRSFAEFPQRICLQDDKIGALLLADPIGHVQEIAEGCDYIEENGKSIEPCLHCARTARLQIGIFQNDLDAAEAHALSGLRACKSGLTEDYAPQYYAALCRIANARQDWGALAQWAKSGELYYGKMGYNISNVEMLMWSALALQNTGYPDDAREAYRRARAAQRKVATGLSAGYYDALAGYHEARGHPHLALIVRGLELQNTSGAPFLECRCRLERIRLLTALNQPVAEELALFEAAAARLRDPDSMLSKLRLSSGRGDCGLG